MKILKWITENPWINLLVSLILIVTSSRDVWTDLQGDFTAMRVGSHHGVFVLGLFQILKTIPDIIGKLREVQENVEKVEPGKSSRTHETHETHKT